MKVKLLSNYFNNKVGDIVEAKRFKDLTIEEIKESLGSYEWDNVNGIFVHYMGNEWAYMIDEEVEIIEE